MKVRFSSNYIPGVDVGGKRKGNANLGVLSSSERKRAREGRERKRRVGRGREREIKASCNIMSLITERRER